MSTERRPSSEGAPQCRRRNERAGHISVSRFVPSLSLSLPSVVVPFVAAAAVLLCCYTCVAISAGTAAARVAAPARARLLGRMADQAPSAQVSMTDICRVLYHDPVIVWVVIDQVETPLAAAMLSIEERHELLRRALIRFHPNRQAQHRLPSAEALRRTQAISYVRSALRLQPQVWGAVLRSWQHHALNYLTRKSTRPRWKSGVLKKRKVVLRRAQTIDDARGGSGGTVAAPARLGPSAERRPQEHQGAPVVRKIVTLKPRAATVRFNPEWFRHPSEPGSDLDPSDSSDADDRSHNRPRPPPLPAPPATGYPSGPECLFAGRDMRASRAAERDLSAELEPVTLIRDSVRVRPPGMRPMMPPAGMVPGSAEAMAASAPDMVEDPLARLLRETEAAAEMEEVRYFLNLPNWCRKGLWYWVCVSACRHGELVGDLPALALGNPRVPPLSPHRLDECRSICDRWVSLSENSKAAARTCCVRSERGQWPGAHPGAGVEPTAELVLEAHQKGRLPAPPAVPETPQAAQASDMSAGDDEDEWQFADLEPEDESSHGGPQKRKRTRRGGMKARVQRDKNRWADALASVTLKGASEPMPSFEEEGTAEASAEPPAEPPEAPATSIYPRESDDPGAEEPADAAEAKEVPCRSMPKAEPKAAWQGTEETWRKGWGTSSGSGGSGDAPWHRSAPTERPWWESDQDDPRAYRSWKGQDKSKGRGKAQRDERWGQKPWDQRWVRENWGS